jgi:hypothetical protein
MGALGWSAIFLTLFVGLIGRLLATEIGVWHKPLCDFLIHLAARRLPKENRVEIEAEWLAIVADLRSPTIQLFHSFTYLLKARQIRNEIYDVEWLNEFQLTRNAALTLLDKVCYFAMAVLAVLGAIALVLAVLATPVWLKVIWGFVAVLSFSTIIWMSTLLSEAWIDVDFRDWLDLLPWRSKEADQRDGPKRRIPPRSGAN